MTDFTFTRSRLDRQLDSTARLVTGVVSGALFLLCFFVTLAVFAVGHLLLWLPWGVALVPAAGVGVLTAVGSWRGGQ